MRCPHCGGQLYSPLAEKRMAELSDRIEDCLDKALSKYEKHGTRQYRDGDYVAKNHGLL